MICSICKKTITDPESIRRGIGPDCWAKMQWEAEQRDRENEVLYIGFNDELRVGFTPQGKRYTTIPHLVVKHSPTGFAWGYGGSGPADLAFNTLLAFGEPIPSCYRLYQAFKEEIIAAIPKEGGTISGDTIRHWIAQHATNKVAQPALLSL